MPGGDGTGPMGQGPRTGRSVGFCAGYQILDMLMQDMALDLEGAVDEVQDLDFGIEIEDSYTEKIMRILLLKQIGKMKKFILKT